ncbi:interferon-inducible GTPase 5-like [Petaurus breviceps papuanus]|uniref:interferon-inducible GTPase 5-like n=1 Tax=Petaurus breviceps papuanus TaxID=3040969 RepID=UPI0036DE68E0
MPDVSPSLLPLKVISPPKLKPPELSPLMAAQSLGTARETRDTLTLTPEEMESFGEVFQGDNLAVISSRLCSTLHSLENARLDIAITGGVGSGKSTFVNALRGLGDEDQGSAKTALVETSLDPTPYPHPKYPNIIIWDLPSIGSPLLQDNKYLERVPLKHYDLFLILASERFTTSHTQLASAIQAKKKHFYFIRSKIDIDIAASSQRRPSTFSEEGVLLEIRENCHIFLHAEGVVKPKVFLLSMFELGKFDFQLLVETIAQELESFKRHAFLVALPNVSQFILEKKAISMLQHVWLVATVACTLDVKPVPGVPEVACDLDLLMRSLASYRRSFGLESATLYKLAERTGGSLQAMQSEVCGPLCEVSKRQVIDLLGRAHKGTTVIFAQELASLPVLGVLASCSLSFATVYQMLRAYLDRAAKDAQKLLMQTFPKAR